MRVPIAMSRHRSVCLIAFWIMVAVTYLLALRQANQAQSQRRKPFGRYTEHDVMQMATPVVRAILPDRNDLYLAAEHGWIRTVNGRPQRIWRVDCTDSQGHDLIHLVRNADNGRIYRVSYSPITAPSPFRPVLLSSQDAVSMAQRWMRTLGSGESWELEGVPEHRTGHIYWHVTLDRHGWRAHVSLDAAAGTLYSADLMPTR